MRRSIEVRQFFLLLYDIFCACACCHHRMPSPKPSPVHSLKSKAESNTKLTYIPLEPNTTMDTQPVEIKPKSKETTQFFLDKYLTNKARQDIHTRRWYLPLTRMELKEIRAKYWTRDPIAFQPIKAICPVSVPCNEIDVDVVSASHVAVWMVSVISESRNLVQAFSLHGAMYKQNIITVEHRKKLSPM